jgi:hypothetical protein
VLIYCPNINAEQLGHLLLAQPEGLVLKEDLDMHRPSGLVGIEDYITFV